MKIRTAIFGTYVIASAVGLAVVMRFVLAEVRPRYVSSIERTMQDSAQLLAVTLSSQPAEVWPEVWAGLRLHPVALRLRVEDSAGRLVFDSQPQQTVAIIEEYA
ncbi:MAG: hypothetical protein J6386_09180 [Candidatus Synoicihabitans palmerolidicus]|nr:hypothetical protein [Candidatus Synoicihabitans palmerolidicus]